MLEREYPATPVLRVMGIMQGLCGWVQKWLVRLRSG